MKNFVLTVLALIAVAALFGGFGSMIWFLVGGPDWTLLAGLSGLTIAIVCVTTADGLSQ